jgi:5'(3')-deoxyribonucleotidase
MTSLTIAVDVDQTIADFLGALCQRFSLEQGELFYPIHMAADWRMPQAFYEWMKEPTFYLNVLPFNGAVSAINTLRDAGHRVIFVTSCVKGTADQKLNWLQDWGFLPLDDHMAREDFFVASDKSLIAADVLFDDRPSTVEDFPGVAYMVMSPQNRNDTARRYCFSIRDAPLLIEQLLAEQEEEVTDTNGLIESLVPIAQELAGANKNGVTISDVRIAAEVRGVLTGEETARELSALGQVMRRAGLVNVGTTRRSELEVTHGVHQIVWFEDLELVAAEAAA